MSSTTFSAIAQATGTIKNEFNVSWSAMHDAVSASADRDGEVIAKTIKTPGGDYGIYRGYWVFDTAGLNDSATIHSAYLQTYQATDINDQNKSCYIVNSTQVSPTILENEDYNNLGTTIYATVLAAALLGTGIKQYAFNATGLSAISKTSYTKLGWRTLYDKNDSPPPTGEMYIATAGPSDATPSRRPVLVVTWTTVPTVTTGSATNKAATTATLGGNVTGIGGGTVSQRGVCWSTGANPTTANSKAYTTGSTGAYTVPATGLSGATVYHYRAYVITENSTQYGSDQTFTTLPSVTTQAVSAIKQVTATGNGNVTSTGSQITQRGVCMNITGTPTTADTTFTKAGTTGAFTTAIISLSPNKKYYVRAYAINTTGTVYGGEVNFTTLSHAMSQIIG